MGRLSLRALSVSRRVPRVQVHMTMTMAPPMARGAQAPSGIFIRFEPKKAMSMIRNGVRARMLTSRLRFHM